MTLIAQILFEVSPCIVLPVFDIVSIEECGRLLVIWLCRPVWRLGLVDFNPVCDLFIILNCSFRKNNGRCRHLSYWGTQVIWHSERTWFDLLFRQHLRPQIGCSLQLIVSLPQLNGMSDIITLFKRHKVPLQTHSPLFTWCSRHTHGCSPPSTLIVCVSNHEWRITYIMCRFVIVRVKGSRVRH